MVNGRCVLVRQNLSFHSELQRFTCGLQGIVKNLEARIKEEGELSLYVAQKYLKEKGESNKLPIEVFKNEHVYVSRHKGVTCPRKTGPAKN